MTDQMACPGGESPRPLAPIYWFTRWLVASLLLAWLAPFAIVAVGFAVGSTLGLSSGDVRESAVAFATLDANSWASAGGAWQTYTWVCYALVVGWRILKAKPVQQLLDRAGSWITKSVERWLAPMGRLLERWPRGVVALTVAVGCGLFIALIGQDSRHTVAVEQIAFPSKPVPTTSAALTLAGGRIQSGEATIDQRGEGEFVVVFKTSGVR